MQKLLFVFLMITVVFGIANFSLFAQETDKEWWTEMKKNVIPQAIKEADEETLKDVSAMLDNWKARIPKEMREQDKVIFTKEMEIFAKTKALNNRLDKTIQKIREHYELRKKTLSKEEVKQDEERMTLVIGLVLYSVADAEGGVIEAYKSIRNEIKVLIANYEVDLQQAQTYSKSNPLDFEPIVDKLNNNVIAPLRRALVAIETTIELHEMAKEQFINKMLTLQRLVVLTRDVNIEIIESVLKVAQESQKIAKDIVAIKF